MSRTRTATAFLTIALVCCACESRERPAPVALAGIGVTGAAGSGAETWQGTVTRRIRWGQGIDPMVAPFPDGERMAVIDWATGDVAVYDLDSGEMTRLTEQPAPYAEGVALFPIVSPDGSRVAYSWQDMRENMLEIQLRVVGTDGRGAEQLYRGPSVPWIHAAHWSPDGSRVLAYRSTEQVNEIATVSTANGAITVLRTLGPREVTQLRFSPDGRFIAWDYPASEDTDDRDIHVMAADGTNESVLVEGPANDRLLGWAPDGRSVLFLSDRAGTPGAWLIPVADGRATGEPYLVKPDMWAVEPIGFADDGRYFYAVGVGARAMYEATLSADGRSLATPPTDLSSRTHREVQYPRWSPDGQYIAFTAPREGRPPALRIRSSESGEEREVSLDRRVYSFGDLEWMPDGRSLVAVARIDEPPQPNAFIDIDVRTGQTTILVLAAQNEFISGITVSPDGRTVYYSLRHIARSLAEGRERIVARNLATGAERTLFEKQPNPPGYIRGLTVSPDGATLVFADGDEADMQLHLLPADGGSPRTIANGRLSTTTWTPDSRALLLTRRAEPAVNVNPVMRLERLEIATGEVTDLGLERKSLRAPGFHPDGRRLLFVAGAPEFEWWVMEGFLGTRQPPGGAGRGN